MKKKIVVLMFKNRMKSDPKLCIDYDIFRKLYRQFTNVIPSDLFLIPDPKDFDSVLEYLFTIHCFIFTHLCDSIGYCG